MIQLNPYVKIISLLVDLKAMIAIQGEELSLEYVDKQVDEIIKWVKSLEKKNESYS